MRWCLCLSLMCLVPVADAQLTEHRVLADMEEDFEGYSGVVRDTEVVHGGAASARWGDHPTSKTARFDQVLADWTGFDNLQFWLNSKVANGAEFILIISSENPETEGIDYWSRKTTVDWTGWRLFRIPIQSLGRGAREPRGWDQIDRFYFTTSGWNCEPREDTLIWIDDVRLTNDPVRVGIEDVRAERRQGTILGTHRIGVTNQLDRQLRLRPQADGPQGTRASFEPGELTLDPGQSARLTATVEFPADLTRDPLALSDEQVTVRFLVGEQAPEEAVTLRLPLNVSYFASFGAPAHPRVLLNEELLADLRRRAQEEERAGQVAEGIVRSADRVIERYADGFPEEEVASIERGRNLTGRAETLAMAYLLTQDEKYAHQAASLITAARSWSTWVYEFHSGLAADLGTAGALRHFGTAYDWAYQGMTTEERAACRETIEIGLDLWLTGIEQNTWWSRSFRNNWCAVCCGGGGIAAVALLGEDPDAPKVLAEAYPRIVSFLNEGGVDGGWPEGTGYWGYGVSHAALFAEALKVLSQGEVNLFEHPYLQVTWQFPLYMHCPPNGTINFADCGYGRPNAQLALQIGRETGNPYAVWYYRLRPGGGTLDLLWDGQDLAAREPTDLPQSTHFRGIDWAALRSGWNNDATIFGIRGGNNGENHGMLECGNFVINSRGERLIMDYGATKYTHEYFSSKRWDFYRANSHGSNVVLVDDQDQLPGRAAAGQITGFFTSEAFDYLGLDATKAYRDFVKKIERRVVFIKPDLFVVLDNVETEGERSFEWRCHPATQGEVALGDDKMAVENGRAGLAVRWLMPGGVSAAGEQNEGEDYHVSVRPDGKADRVRFLTVMRCQDAGAARALFELPPEQAAEELAKAPRVLLMMGAEGNEWRLIHDLIRGQGIEVDWLGEDRFATLPADGIDLTGYAAILLVPTDQGAAAFSPEQQQALVDYVRGGGGLVLGGGTKSFGAGGFDKTPVADILPVEIIRPDDNITDVKQRPFVSSPDHPVLAGLPEQWPAFGSAYGGYYDVRLKQGATKLLGVDRAVAEGEVPFIAVHEAGEGRVMTFGALWAFGTGEEFKSWAHAGRFFVNAVEWLSHGRAEPDTGRELTRVSLEAPYFSLSDENVTILESDAGVGCMFLDPEHGSEVVLRTGPGRLEAGEVSTDGQALVVFYGDDRERGAGAAAVAATRIEANGHLELGATEPVSFAIWSELEKGRGVISCEEPAEITIRLPRGQVLLDGEPVPLRPAAEDGCVEFSLPAGRHVVQYDR